MIPFVEARLVSDNPRAGGFKNKIAGFLKPKRRSIAPKGRQGCGVDEPEVDSLTLARLRRGDSSAFTQLVNEHQQLVLALGQSMGITGADLDDAAAETFANVYLALPGFEGRSQLRTWVYRIALRTLFKCRQRRAAVTNQNLPEEQGDYRQHEPAKRMESAELREKLWLEVARLDGRTAAAIELHYRQGWPLPRIAEVMECPLGTVKTLLHRGRQQLRAALKAQEIGL